MIIGCDSKGAVYDAPDGSSDMRRWLVENTNAEKRTGSLKEVLVGADVFIGVSAPNLLDGSDIANMAKDAIVFGLANPIPEVDPLRRNDMRRSWRPAVATTPIRSTTCWPFLGSSAVCSTAACATSPTRCCPRQPMPSPTRSRPDQLNPSYIIPSVFDASVAPAVAAAVREIGEPARSLPVGSLCSRSFVAGQR